MLNIIIPMAGRGARFQEAGYRTPKPLIPVHGIPMIEAVINNLRPSCPHRFTFLCQREDSTKYDLSQLLNLASPECNVVLLDGVTEGAACTVLLARHVIDDDNPLMIANCDQWVDLNINNYLAAFDRSGASGFIMTMHSESPKWSYVKRSALGRVEGVVEKQVVSPEATVGIYNFARGKDFVRAADAMIAANERVNGEFYVAPAFTWMIREGATVETYSVGADQKGMYGLGTPQDLTYFLTLGFASRLQQEANKVNRRAA